MAVVTRELTGRVPVIGFAALIVLTMSTPSRVRAARNESNSGVSLPDWRLSVGSG